MFIRFAISASWLCLLFSCNSNGKSSTLISDSTLATHPSFPSLIIDSALATHPIFPLMDKVHQSFDFKDSVLQSSNLEFCHSFDKEARFYCENNYLCTAYLENSKTLVIQLSAFYYQASDGIKIRYSNKSYSINEFAWNHTHIGDNEYPLNVYSNNLQLNRSEYKPGDSVFGYIYARAFVNIEERPTGVLLQGHFRAKIGDR
jgi:hypothetical protein